MANRILNALLLLLVCSTVTADTLRIACASNFRSTLETLSAKFSEQTQHDVLISSASSGVLYAQINHGAPYHLFFSADAYRPQQLIKKELAIEKSLTTYALGRLFLLHTVDINNVKQEASIEARINHIISKAQRIAIANPRSAPYGRAAKSLLDKRLQSIDATLLQASNVAQALQFFQTGHADAAFVAASLLSKETREKNIEVTGLLQTGIKQQAVLLTQQPSTGIAEQFLAFIKMPAAQQIILEDGYLLAQNIL